MEIKVKRTKYPEDFKNNLAKAIFKGTTARLIVDDTITVIATANKRVVGRFVFVLDNKVCKLKSRQIIEREFFPLEVTVDTLVKYFKRKKVKLIII
jgi:hypothetical protein